MTSLLIFSGVAAALVYLAGRRDAARDPALTTVALLLLAVFPLLVAALPKIGVLPARSVAGSIGGFSWPGVVFHIWSAGLGLALLRLLASAMALTTWRRRSRWIASRDGIEIRELSTLKSPVAAGVFRKIIFVPASWRDWSEPSRQIVLAHESAHHRRHDPLWRWVAGISCAVNWYNPLVWWMARRLSLQCEYACDAGVLHQGVSARDYAGLLCNLAEDSAPGVHAMAMAQRSSLERRVRRLTHTNPAGGSADVRVMMLGVTCAAAIAALIGPKANPVQHFTPEEVQTRWTANPFPGEN